MAAKQYRARKGISLSSEEEDESDIRDNTDSNQADPDQANNKYLVELLEGMCWKLQITKWGYSFIH